MHGTAISATSYTGVFRGEPDQVSQARREVARYLQGCPAAEDAELVTNAVLHSRSRHGMLTVHSERYPRYAWLEVTDAGGDWQSEGGSDGGRGLAIVAALAAEWGIDGDARAARSGHGSNGERRRVPSSQHLHLDCGRLTTICLQHKLFVAQTLLVTLSAGGDGNE